MIMLVEVGKIPASASITASDQVTKPSDQYTLPPLFIVPTQATIKKLLLRMNNLN